MVLFPGRIDSGWHDSPFSVCEEHCPPAPVLAATFRMERAMHGIIYLVGLIVVILAILSFFGLR
jgi:hypothetical protein